jgi:type I restriction enzyme S subunit
VTDGIPTINPANLRDGRIYPDWNCTVDQVLWNQLSRHELQEGDIVFARRGEMGRCALVTLTEAGWLCGTGSIRVRPRLDVSYPKFLSQVLSTNGISEWLLLESVGTTMDNLNTQIISRIPLPNPPIFEQKNIVEYLESETVRIDEAIANVKDQIAKLEEYRTALISDAVTGKIDVRGFQ